VVELQLRDFKLGGVSLEGEEQERYNVIQQELAQLATKFENNVIDATNVRRVWGGEGAEFCAGEGTLLLLCHAAGDTSWREQRFESY
jgi:hypothetical protein